METEYLSRAEAADYLTRKGLRITKLTLQKMATSGGGPKFQKFGNRAVYTPANLDAWAEEKLGEPVSSTSEAGTYRPGTGPKAAKPKGKGKARRTKEAA